MSGMTPTAVAQQSLDAIGIEHELGDIENGTREAKVLLRAYGECLRQLLRGAPWDFARREVPLVLLADATGQTANVGAVVPGSQFIYEYQYPIDCARVRYIPSCDFLNPSPPAGNIQTPAVPITTGLGQPPYVGRAVRPTRYLITNDQNYPPEPGAITWEVQGVSPQGRIVILSNVQNANIVYTCTPLYPSVWDHLFRGAMVAYLASEVALVLNKDKKMGLTLRDQQIKVAKEKIIQARIADGNEMWASTDHIPDWIQTRNAGRGSNGWGSGWGGGGDGSFGCWGNAWAGSVLFGNGSAF